MLKKLYIDFDGVIVDTIRRITELYNEDYMYYDDFEPISPGQIKTWDFDELFLASRKTINLYFNQPRFFNSDLMIMTGAINYIQKLKLNGYEIVVVSLGQRPNLRQKKRWINQNLDYNEFIGVDISVHSNKDHIDMSDGIFIDDMTNNLNNSNAAHKICFGKEYVWNKDWTGDRCYNWEEVYNKLHIN